MRRLLVAASTAEKAQPGHMSGIVSGTFGWGAANMAIDTEARRDFVISRSADTDAYGLWRVDYDSADLLTPVPLDDTAAFDKTHQIASIGRYLLEWGPIQLKDYQPCFPYRLIEFHPTSPDPLHAKPLQKGAWLKSKFWGARPDFGNPQGAKENFDQGEQLLLLPLDGFMLNVIPTDGRGTFGLWNFDPNPVNPCKTDPLPQPYTYTMWGGSSFDTIDYGHELLPICGYVLDRLPKSGEYWLWSFDPSSAMPLALPAIQSGRWPDIDDTHKLVVLGDLVLDWRPSDRGYRLWAFNPKSPNPLVGPVGAGVLPAALHDGVTLLGVQAQIPINPARAQEPGSIDFMRDKVKHVVYLMLENRSFDHVLGWLYQKGETGINFVGRDGPFDGASLDMFNVDPSGPQGPEKVYLQKYDRKPGKPLDFLPSDPYHDKTDVVRQMFYEQPDGYAQRQTPQMKGFVWNNGVPEIMWTYTPDQLPVINGLAREYGVSDAWFSSMPSATDPNRAFAFTGSSLRELNNFQNGPQYLYWPYAPHRSSIWKALWTDGFTDWKIYNSVLWMNFVHTYHLYLQGQIPSVDAAIAQDAALRVASAASGFSPAPPSSFLEGIDQFKAAARAGQLPRFSFLEPVWISLAGTTSYHPGADPSVGEKSLNELYEAMKSGPAWNETLFVITFDEHGGIFDHAPPPYAENPWPNDVIDGFRFDMMGVRVPTILVSPLIKRQTVFRSPTAVAYDSTSILATLLNWYGVPKARWGLGERARHAPTFEGVFQLSEPRADKPLFEPPNIEQSCTKPRVSDLDLLMAPRIAAALARGQLTPSEMASISNELMASSDMEQLHATLLRLATKRIA
jgi:phospholipase C